jgi:hypothetical protein
MNTQVPRILAANDTAMSAQELLQHMQAPHADPPKLERLLRFLTCKAMFTEHIERGDGDDEPPQVVRRFSLTPLSRMLAPGGTLANAAFILTMGPELAVALPHLWWVNQLKISPERQQIIPIELSRYIRDAKSWAKSFEFWDFKNNFKMCVLDIIHE